MEQLYIFIATNLAFISVYAGILLLTMMVINGVASFVSDDLYDYSFNNGYKSIRYVGEYIRFVSRFTSRTTTIGGKVIAVARANATLYSPNYLMVRVLALVGALLTVINDLSGIILAYFFVLTFTTIAWNLYVVQESDRRAA